MNRTLLPIACMGATLLFLTAAVNTVHAQLVVEDGYVSIQAADIGLVRFLEDLSRSAKLKLIFAAAPDPHRRIQVDFNRKPIHDVLQTLLKGKSYAVVFNNVDDDPPFLITYDSIFPTSPAAKNDPGYVTPDDGEPQRQAIEQKMQTLERRIASGQSDIEYQKWTGVRDSKYVTHDRDRLARLRESD